ncbi:MAG: cytochrome c1 [Panacagrimonas sp.]
MKTTTKTMIAKLGLLAASLVLSSAAMGAGGHALPYEFHADVTNLPSVQRGAKVFMNYCSGCHSMKFMRYGRIGQDLKIPEDLLKANLMFTSDKLGDQILSAIPSASAAGWFGQAPPDLTLETRARGESWVYSYLKTFYVDPSRPLGVNNLVLPGASMPHVLWELQGWQVKEEHKAEATAEEDHGAHHGPPLKLVKQGSLSPDEYDKFVGDLVNYMAYAAEPGRAGRIALGSKAILFLLILLVLAYLLKKEYWKDVH